jgi:hypothetical protein
VRLADGDQQGVQLVEQRGVGGQVRLEERPGPLVVRAGRQQPVADQHPTGVGVGREDGTAGRVQEDRVGGLGSQTRHPQQLAPQRSQRRPAHRAELAREARQEPAGEGLQAVGLEPVRPGGAHERGQRGEARGGKPSRPQQAPRAQRPHGAGRARPGGVLGEDRPHGDLERGAGRPPALRAVMPQQRPVQAQQASLERIARWTGDASPRSQHRPV